MQDIYALKDEIQFRTKSTDKAFRAALVRTSDFL
jgi:hypothetical protein